MTHLKKSLKLVQTLHNAGYTAYYAGGWVRDHLLGQESGEVDIATNASPDTIEALFPKTIAVGKAFGVIVVIFEGTQFEVATFRKDHPYHDGRHPDGIDFSTPEKDAQRRDFTINGMFFDPLTEEIHDYVDGQSDLKKQVIRAIGDPLKRFEEDRLRMIRAVRFAARLGFHIEERTQHAIKSQAHTLFPSVSMERIWQELQKMAQFPHFDQAMITLDRFGLLKEIFPTVENVEKRVKPFSKFPKHCPTILYIRELIPDGGAELCRYLKGSNRDAKLLEFFQIEPQDLVEWAYFYAHEFADLRLKIDHAKGFSLTEHRQRQEKLKKHIERIKRKKPLITASHLQKQGVKPGKQMGELLKEAERIAITQDINNAKTLLEKLNLPPFE
ncbi:MAG: CCA-adding enzyme [Chlamydiales bacterium]|nr:CCA-adding enzyme [Chlamydiales bacterium]MCH9619477.1 CCA-adding enzyme [Chlamydiales bacterium]MCH9622281.1 CCA-adding enzyme [Chlamydiales bacterium]